MIKIESCPDTCRMRDHACANRAQCWEPCGLLGKSEAHARPVPDLHKAYLSGGPLSGAKVED